MRSLIELGQGGTNTPVGLAGSDLKHESAHKHVTGEAQYTDDIPTPANCLHAYAGFSRIARGRVKSLDLSKVRSAPDVVALLTLQDVPGHRDIGPVFPGDPLLVNQGDEVEFFGQVGMERPTIKRIRGYPGSDCSTRRTYYEMVNFIG